MQVSESVWICGCTLYMRVHVGVSCRDTHNMWVFHVLDSSIGFSSAARSSQKLVITVYIACSVLLAVCRSSSHTFGVLSD